MVKKLLLFVMAAIVAVCSFTSCSSDDDDNGSASASVVGTWVNKANGTTDEIQFKADGTCLENMTMDICGFTKDEVQTVFADDIRQMADVYKVSAEEMYQMIKNKYDGYHFAGGSPSVFNPFSLINAFGDRKSATVQRTLLLKSTRKAMPHPVSPTAVKS